MKRLLLWVAIMTLILYGMGSVAFAAGSTTSSLTVSASVNTSCSITAVGNVSFSTLYDPTNTSPNDSGAGSFTFRCTKGTDYNLYIAGTRTMTFGADTLAYELYTTAGRTTVWPSTLAGAIIGNSPNNSPDTRNIFGRIPAEQDVLTGGPYTGTVTVTVEW